MKCPHLLWISAAQLLPARMRSLRVCKKWMMCMYVPVCAKRLCVSVKPSARRRGGGGGGGGGGGKATDCPSVSQPSLSVLRGAVSSCSRRFCSPVPLPSPPPPTDAIKAGLSEQHRNQAARDAIIPASRSPPTCCDADIKHRDRVGGRY